MALGLTRLSRGTPRTTGSADHVRNGVALSPTYHRAFDAGLIYLDEGFRIRLNDGHLETLRRLNLAVG
ncbi:MAG: HNH endonuclease [Candidatus Binataceae bacterium]